jgi:hypothetical protein
MFRRIGKKVAIKFAILLAYGVVGFNTLFQVPLWTIIAATILLSIMTSLAKLEPFTWDKTALGIFQTPQTYMQVMHTAHLFGDPGTAERIYIHTTPETQNTRTATQLRTAAYPQEKLEQLRSFWTAILAKQPSSREAYAALTAIHYSLHEKEALPSTQ